jgi:Flp pilus assembly protein TadG
MRLTKIESKGFGINLHFTERGRRARGSESGQSLVEVALMLPFLLLLALGVIEIGRYAYASILVANAARAGAAYGSQNHFTAANPTTTTYPNGIIVAAADNDFKNNGQPVSNLTVTKAYLCQCDNAGTFTTLANCTTGVCPAGQHEEVSLTVTATGTFSSLFSYPGIPPSISVTKSATLRIGD